jgi:hypothetical protein
LRSLKEVFGLLKGDTAKRMTDEGASTILDQLDFASGVPTGIQRMAGQQKLSVNNLVKMGNINHIIQQCCDVNNQPVPEQK